MGVGVGARTRGGRGRAVCAASAAALLLVATHGATTARPALAEGWEGPPASLPHAAAPGLDTRLAQVVAADRTAGPAAALATSRSQALGVSAARLRVEVEAGAGMDAGA